MISTRKYFVCDLGTTVYGAYGAATAPGNCGEISVALPVMEKLWNLIFFFFFSKIQELCQWGKSFIVYL